MTTRTEVPVLIVGAGPTGLTLACELARRGIACRVVDSAPELFVGSRGKGLQPRTMEVFDDLGVVDEVLASGAPFPSFRMYAGTTVRWTRPVTDMLGVQPADPATGVPYPALWLLPQWRTDEILRDRFVALGGRVELATALTGFTQDEDGVTATLRHDGTDHQVRADYLVGTDGGRSLVRRTLGVGFEGETFETERTLIGDVRATGLDGVYCHVLTSGDITDRFSLWSMPGTDHYQFVASMSADEVPELTLESVQKILDQRSGRTDIRLSDLTWMSLYRVNVRMVDRFRVDRVLLAGDAAHVHSSASGQGLNTSVQDAYNLGWKLAAVLTGAPGALLDTYEAERFPVAADVLGLSTAMHRRNFRGPAADEADADPDVFQLRITYRGGPLASEAGTERLRSGDRAPDARCITGSGTPVRLFELFRGPHWTLLGFGAEAAAGVDAVVARHGAVRGHVVVRAGERGGVVDAAGEAYRNYGIAAPRLVLVRPDGHLGEIGDAGRIDAYLARVLGAPTGHDLRT